METLRTYNCNKQLMVRTMPKIVLLEKFVNETAIEHIYQNTGIQFVKGPWNYEAQPTTSNEVMRLLLTYNFKTQYHDNGSDKNTLFLKFCKNEGFKVDSICF